MIRVYKAEYCLEIALGVFLCLISLFQIFFTGINSFKQYFIPLMIFTLILIIYILLSCLISQNGIKKILIGKLDYLVIIYLSYGLINYVFINENPIEPALFFKWIFICILYFVYKLLPHRNNIIFYFIVFTGFIQSVVGLLQISGFISSLNSYFNITGLFRNSGHLAAYLSVSLTISLYLIVANKNNVFCKKQTKYLLIPTALIIFVAMLCCKSRTAIVALIISLLFMAYYKGWLASINRKIKRLIVCGVLAFGLVFCILLYMIRPESANSRLLIWNVSLRIFNENPIFGSGVASFKREYMYSQAYYFKDNPNSKFRTISNNHYQAFNEFIHVACEQGILGLLLFCAIIGYALVKGKNIIAKISLVSLIVISSFLYTADIFPIIIMFPIFLGQLTHIDNSLVKIRVNYRGNMIVLCLLSVILVSSCKFYIKYKNTSLALLSFMHTKDEKSLLDVKQNYNMIKHHRYFSLVYTKQLLAIEDKEYVISVFEDIIKISPTSEMINDLGDLYLVVNKYDKAEMCYLLADIMVPSRIIPINNLFKLYVLVDNKEKAISTAKLLLNKELGSVGSIAIKARNEAKIYLNSTLSHN